MTSRDTDLDASAQVIVRCQQNRAAVVQLSDRSNEDEDCVQYAIHAQAPGLTARVEGLVAWPWDGDLAPFLKQLAEDYRGWDGERFWQTTDRDLTVTAVFRSGGHVGLTWTLRPWRTAVNSWEASVTTWLEAGEQMTALAADVRYFLNPESPASTR